MFLTLLALLIAFALMQKGAKLSAGGGSAPVSALAAGAAAALPGLAIAAFSARQGVTGLAAGSTVGAAAALLALGAGTACLIRPVRERDNRLPAFALTALTASAVASVMLADATLGTAEAWILLLPGLALVVSCIASKDSRPSLRGGAARALGTTLLFAGCAIMTIRLCAFASASGIADIAVESTLLPTCLACPALLLAVRAGAGQPRDGIRICLATATLCLSFGLPAAHFLGGFSLSRSQTMQFLPYLGISAAVCGIPIAITGRGNRVLGGILLGIGAVYTVLTMLTY